MLRCVYLLHPFASLWRLRRLIPSTTFSIVYVVATILILSDVTSQGTSSACLARQNAAAAAAAAASSSRVGVVCASDLDVFLGASAASER